MPRNVQTGCYWPSSNISNTRVVDDGDSSETEGEGDYGMPNVTMSNINAVILSPPPSRRGGERLGSTKNRKNQSGLRRFDHSGEGEVIDLAGVPPHTLRDVDVDGVDHVHEMRLNDYDVCTDTWYDTLGQPDQLSQPIQPRQQTPTTHHGYNYGCGYDGYNGYDGFGGYAEYDRYVSLPYSDDVNVANVPDQFTVQPNTAAKSRMDLSGLLRLKNTRVNNYTTPDDVTSNRTPKTNRPHVRRGKEPMTSWQQLCVRTGEVTPMKPCGRSRTPSPVRAEIEMRYRNDESLDPPEGWSKWYEQHMKQGRARGNATLKIR